VDDQVLREGDLEIRRLRNERPDLELMARWLSDERILEFYGGRDDPLDLDGVIEHYVRRAGPDALTVGCIIELEDRPIGYVQFYAWVNWPEEVRAMGVEPDDAWGIDLFIGETDVWGRGIGTRVVDVVSRHLFERCGARVVTLDPLMTNGRAIRSYEKAGYRKVRIVKDTEAHEGEIRDLWLMVRERDEEPSSVEQ
jgi:aminoglycoside 6'-N-acetyltransferase